MITLTAFKLQASILKNYLNQNNASITHSSCLHAVAKMYGFKDWNTAAAYLKDQSDIDNKTTGNKSELSSMLSAKVMEGALYQLIKLCNVNDVSKGLTVIRATSDESNDNPIAFKLKCSGSVHEEMISCGNFTSIKDKDEAAFLSGHYLAFLIHNVLTAKLFTKTFDDTNNNSDLKYEFKDSYTVQQNKLKEKFRGMRVKITFECHNAEEKPTLLKVKNIIDSTPSMNDDVFLEIENTLSHYYFLIDGFEDEIRIYKQAHPEFADDRSDWVATIEPVAK